MQFSFKFHFVLNLNPAGSHLIQKLIINNNKENDGFLNTVKNGNKTIDWIFDEHFKINKFIKCKTLYDCNCCQCDNIELGKQFKREKNCIRLKK